MENYGFDPQTILETVYYIENSINDNQVIVNQEHKKFIKWLKGLKKEDKKRYEMIYGNRIGEPLF